MKATYTNSGVRRQDRLLGLEQALTLLQNGEHGVLSMTCRDGQAYGIPVNFVWNGREAIYLHCAPEGRKLDCIRFNNHVSFCVTGKTKVIPEKLTQLAEQVSH